MDHRREARVVIGWDLAGAALPFSFRVQVGIDAAYDYSIQSLTRLKVGRIEGVGEGVV